MIPYNLSAVKEHLIAVLCVVVISAVRQRGRGARVVVLHEDVVRQAPAHLRVDKEGVEPEMELLGRLAPDLCVDSHEVQPRLCNELDLEEAERHLVVATNDLVWGIGGPGRGKAN